jgi:hypothetical protein
MDADTVNNVVEVAALAVVVVTCLISVGMTARTRIRAHTHVEADAALKQAQEAREEAARQLVEAQQLAARFREHREWIEAHPERLRAAVLAQLTATDAQKSGTTQGRTT